MSISPRHISQLLPNGDDAERWISCGRKRRFDPFSGFKEAVEMAHRTAPKDRSWRHKVYICKHCNGLHLASNYPPRKKLVRETNTVERDKLIAAGIVNGTAPVAQQKPLAALTPKRALSTTQFTWQSFPSGGYYASR